MDEPVKNVRVSDPVISDRCTVRWEAPCLKKNLALKGSLFAFENFVLLTEISSYRILRFISYESPRFP